MQQKRKKVWIHRFQTYLMFRIALYFVLYQVAVWSLVILEYALVVPLEGLLGPTGTAYFFLFLSFIVLFVGVLFIRDALLFAHRIVGPLHRLSLTIKAVTAGEEVAPINFRKDDFLFELRDDFNEMLDVLQQRGAVTVKRPEPAANARKPQPV